MNAISVPILPTSLWLLSTAGGISLVMVCFFLYVYMRRRFMAAHGDMTDVADLAALKMQLVSEKTVLEQRISNQMDELLRFQAEREEQERLRADLARLQTECASIEQQMMELRIETGELESNRHTLAQTNERLNAERETLEGQIRELELQKNTLSDLQAQIAEAERALRETLENKDVLLREIRDMTERITEIQLKHESSQRRYNSLSIELQSLEQLINQKNTEAKDAQQSLQEGKSKLTEVEDKLQEKGLSLMHLDEKHYQLEKGISRLEADRANFEEQIEALQLQVSELKEQQPTLIRTIDKLTAEAADAQKRAQASRQTADHLEQEARQRKIELKQLEDLYNEGKTEIRQLEADRAALDLKIKELDAKLMGEKPGDSNEQYEDLLKTAPACLEITIFNAERLNNRSEEEAMDNVIHGLGKLGYRFDDRVVKAFHTSLKCHDINPLTVLAGVSGTGKTLLPMAYAKLMGMHSLVMAVQPRWDSPQDMFGFYNFLERRYKATDLARALVRMDTYNTPKGLDPKQKFPGRMLLVLMDEMNLARTEYYFSEFLSKLELRRDITNSKIAENRIHAEIVLDTGPGRDDLRLWVDSNVLFVGTMNEDESTQTLSDKVLDRANVLRFGRPKNISMPKASIEEPEVEGYLSKKQWESWYRNVEARSWTEDVTRWVNDLNDALNRIGRPFGYRVQKSILTYVQNYPGIEGHDVHKKAFADQIEQKVLPKLRGIDLLEGTANTALEKIEDIIFQTNDDLLFQAFKDAKEEAASGMFLWRGVSR